MKEDASIVDLAALINANLIKFNTIQKVIVTESVEHLIINRYWEVSHEYISARADLIKEKIKTTIDQSRYANILELKLLEVQITHNMMEGANHFLEKLREEINRIEVAGQAVEDNNNQFITSTELQNMEVGENMNRNGLEENITHGISLELDNTLQTGNSFHIIIKLLLPLTI